MHAILAPSSHPHGWQTCSCSPIRQPRRRPTKRLPAASPSRTSVSCTRIEAVLIVVFSPVFLAVTLQTREPQGVRGPEAYEVDARKGKKTFASFTMIWSGLFVVAFLISHLYMLKFGEYLLLPEYRCRRRRRRARYVAPPRS